MTDHALLLPARRLTTTHKVVIYLILGSAFVVMLNETLIAVALPTVMDGFDINPSTGQWLLTTFMLTTAVVIPLSGCSG
jgi:MFS transporter, DHA2 family, lincomycin resistance protein